MGTDWCSPRNDAGFGVYSGYCCTRVHFRIAGIPEETGSGIATSARDRRPAREDPGRVRAGEGFSPALRPARGVDAAWLLLSSVRYH